MRRVGAVAALIACLACAGTAQAAPATPLGHEGRWITDAEGKVVILHGVNMVFKRPPYHPAATGFDEPDAAFLAEHGFNTVRLGLIYKAVEPSPGVYDEVYLGEIAATEQTLAREGIFSQLDFHQDLYNERFGGEGWPDWATIDDGLPAQPLTGFPASYVSSPGLNQAFNNFWANRAGPGGVGLQDRYAAAFRRVAERFASLEHTIGYDLMNEPWPGIVWPTCANPAGCPVFDTATLAAFHQRVLARIREVDTQKLVWYEPNVVFNFGADSSHPPTGDSRTGFSFHVYCLAGAFAFPGLPSAACDVADELVFDNADKQAQETGDALLMSEFGATDDLDVIRRNVESAEDHMVSWQYWHYCACDDPTTSGPGVQALVVDASQPPSGANLKEAKLDVLARPYPQLVAGTPTAFGFDASSTRFELTYSPTGPGGQSFVPTASPVPVTTPQSEIFIPPRHYPGGYTAEVTGGAIASEPGASVLRVAACPGASEVNVVVVPGDAGASVADCELAGTPGAGGPGAGAPQTESLRLKLRPRRARADRRTCLRATVTTASAAPIDGATVRSGRKSRLTGPDGRARLCRRFSKSGRPKVLAAKAGFAGAETRLRVRRSR